MCSRKSAQCSTDQNHSSAHERPTSAFDASDLGRLLGAVLGDFLLTSLTTSSSVCFEREIASDANGTGEFGSMKSNWMVNGYCAIMSIAF